MVGYEMGWSCVFSYVLPCFFFQHSEKIVFCYNVQLWSEKVHFVIRTIL